MDFDPLDDFLWWKWLYESLGTNSTNTTILAEIQEEVGRQYDSFFEHFVSFSHQYNLFKGDVQAFTDAINWSDDVWISGILSLHAVVFTCILLCRNTNIRCIILFSLLTLVMFCQYLNTYLGKVWQSFSTQNYFGGDGIFILIIFAAPCLLNAVVCLVFLYVDILQLSISAKRMQLVKANSRNRSVNPTAGTDPIAEAATPQNTISPQ